MGGKRGYDPGRALGLLVFAATVMGCADGAAKPGPPRHLDGGAACVGDDCTSSPQGCPEAAPGCPCATEGEHIACGQVEIEIANQTVCGTGDSVCSEGFWAPCVINNTAPIAPPAAPRRIGAVHTYSLGKPSPCTANPCDPSCRDFLDTSSGEGNVDAGIAEEGAGLTLLPVGPPPAVFVAGDFTRDYDASGICAPGSTPVWGLWSWRAKTPKDAFVSFSVQTAATAKGLAAAPVDALQFSSPPALVGQHATARLGPPDTTVGSAIVDATLVNRGRLRGLPFLRIVSHLAPSSDGHSAPVLIAWDLQVSCAQSE